MVLGKDFSAVQYFYNRLVFLRRRNSFNSLFRLSGSETCENLFIVLPLLLDRFLFRRQNLRYKQKDAVSRFPLNVLRFVNIQTGLLYKKQCTAFKSYFVFLVYCQSLFQDVSAVCSLLQAS